MTATCLRKEFIQRAINRYLPTAALIAIAGIQIYRAQILHQTAWKGGGFGMFATADSPDCRYFRCALVTPEGDIPVQVPVRFRDAAWKARVAPTQNNLNALAHEMLKSTWVPADFHYRHLAQLVRSEDSSTTAGRKDGDSHSPPDPPDDTAPADLNLPGAQPRGDGASRADPSNVPSAIRKTDRKLSYRLKARQEPDPDPGESPNVIAVRVDLWRYDFDSRTASLKTYPWFSVVLRKSPQ